MITVENAESYRTCNVCYSEKGVKNILFRYEGTNGGSQIALCGKCIAKLVDLLEPYAERRTDDD